MGKRGKGGDKKGDGDLKEEEVLQAILLADSFSQAFRPVSLEIPKVLMPVVNVPMIDYTLEWLGSQGVDEVFVFCSAHAAAVEQYLLESKWTVVPEGKKEEEAEVKNVWRRPVVHIERSDTCTSAGDALREIDGRGLIHSDPFVLVSGDVISNMNLKQVVDTHKQRRKADSSSIMTVVLKKARTMHPTRPLNDDLVVITDGTTGQMLVYEDDVEAPLVELLAERMQEHQSVAFRYDLLDTHVDVCSPEVLLHFSDNYDYQDVRRDYLRNEVRNADLGWKFFAHVLEGEYAARIQDLRTYDAICRDVVRRWTYPLVPDANFNGATTYSHSRNATFTEEHVHLDQRCEVSSDSVIGSRTLVGANARLIHCVVGRNCRVGRGCTITNAYLWDGVTVEDGATVDRALLCAGSIIGRGARIERGAVVSFSVRVGAGVVVPEFTRLTRCVQDLGESGSEFSGPGRSRTFSTTSARSAGAAGPSRGTSGEGEGGEEGDGDGAPSTEEGAPFSDDRDGPLGRTAVFPGSDSQPGPSLRRRREAGTSQSGVDVPVAAAESQPEVVGPDGRGRKWTVREWDLDETLPRSMRSHEVPRAVEAMGMGAEDGLRHRHWDDFAAAEELEEEEEEEETPEEAWQRFLRVVADMLTSAQRNKTPVENALLEVRGFKYAENREFADCVRATMAVILDMIPDDAEDMDAIKAAQGLLQKWAPLLQQLTIEQEAEDIQRAAIETVEAHCLREDRAAHRPLFGFLLQLAWMEDVIGEAAVRAWAEERDGEEADSALAQLRHQPRVLKFLEQLDQEAGGDESSSGSGSGSGSDDDGESSSSGSDDE